jgi:hypothetical protein
MSVYLEATKRDDFDQRFEAVHRRDRLLTEHSRELDRRQTLLRERTRMLDAMERLMHERRRRLMAELVLVGAIENATARRSVMSGQ